METAYIAGLILLVGLLGTPFLLWLAGFPLWGWAYGEWTIGEKRMKRFDEKQDKRTLSRWSREEKKAAREALGKQRRQRVMQKIRARF